MQKKVILSLVVVISLLAIPITAYSLNTVNPTVVWDATGLHKRDLIFIDTVYAINFSGSINCSDIWGTDSDFCNDATGGGGDSKIGAGPFLYNDSTNIYFNDTYGNKTYLTWSIYNTKFNIGSSWCINESDGNLLITTDC